MLLMLATWAVLIAPFWLAWKSGLPDLPAFLVAFAADLGLIALADRMLEG